MVAALGLGVLAYFSLRPLEPLERAVDFFFLPGRVVGDFLAPVRWWSAGAAREAERRSLADVEQQAREVAALLEAEQRHALPRAEWLAGRSIVHGEVARRSAKSLDRALVRLATIEGIEPGLPVVAGEHLVGRVEALSEERPDEVLVALVTASDVFFGAEILPPAGEFGAPTARAVVGGLAPRVEGEPAGAYHLAVHNPSRHAVLSGVVRVREPEALDDPFAALAQGFLLGELEHVQHPGGGVLRRVRPGLDYKGGLYQVLVLRPLARDDGTAREREVRLSLDTLDPTRWRRVRSLGGAGVARGRSLRTLAAGSWSGAREGAALASGAWLVGRVGRVGLLTAGARSLDDPGLTVPAIAWAAGLARPLALGELRSVGSDREGALLFEWRSNGELPTDGALAVRLYTGSGHAGVPRGLLLGDAILPPGAGRHVLRVERDAAHAAVRDPWLWIGGPSEGRP